MLEPGGRHRPMDCRARHRVAIIIPFRDRDIHLKVLLNNIHSMLQRQQIDYGIYVVDVVSSVCLKINVINSTRSNWLMIKEVQTPRWEDIRSSLMICYMLCIEGEYPV